MRIYPSNNGCCLSWPSAAMVTVTKEMCWTVVAKTLDSSGIGLVIYQKPTSSSCYEKRKKNNPPICKNNERKQNSWYMPVFMLLLYIFPPNFTLSALLVKGKEIEQIFCCYIFLLMFLDFSCAYDHYEMESTFCI